MTCELPESGTNARARTIVLWGLMLLGPVAFFLSLMSIGVWLLGMGFGWWGASDTPPSDYVIFAPAIAVVLAEISGGLVASAKSGSLRGTPFESHANSLTRTFWIMVAGFAVSICLAFSLLLVPNIEAAGFGVGALFIALFTLPLFFIWKTFRAIRGLRRAVAGQPIADIPAR
jgi:uncharacterized membrane protein